MPTPNSELPSPNITSLDNAQPTPNDDTLEELDRLPFREILDEDPRPSFVLALDKDSVAAHSIRPIFCNASLRQYERLLRSIVYALQKHPSNEANTAYREFRDWTTKTVSLEKTLEDASPFTLEYHGMCWTQWTVRGKWRIIGGTALFRLTKENKKDLRPAASQHNAVRNVESEVQNLSKERIPAVSPSIQASLSEDAQQLNTTSESLGTKTRPSVSRTSSTLTLSSPDEDIMIDWTVPHPTGIVPDHIAYARGVDWASTPLGPMETW
jgi:hypothetical protein